MIMVHYVWRCPALPHCNISYAGSYIDLNSNEHDTGLIYNNDFLNSIWQHPRSFGLVIGSTLGFGTSVLF